MEKQKAPPTMGRYRAIMTETDRDYIASGGGVDENKRHQSISRVRNRVTEELPRDIEILKRHHQELLEELRNVVCDDTLEVPNEYRIVCGGCGFDGGSYDYFADPDAPEYCPKCGSHVDDDDGPRVIPATEEPSALAWEPEG